VGVLPCISHACDLFPLYKSGREDKKVAVFKFLPKYIKLKERLSPFLTLAKTIYLLSKPLSIAQLKILSKEIQQLKSSL
jgi:hypothetical protein